MLANQIARIVPSSHALFSDIAHLILHGREHEMFIPESALACNENRCFSYFIELLGNAGR